MVLAQAKEDMKRNPRLTLPEDPNVNIWNYYSIMKVTPIIMDNFLLVILTIPLSRSVSGDEFIQGAQYANPTPRTTRAI